MSQTPFRPAKLKHEIATTSAGVRVLVATGVSQYGDWLTTVALLTVLYKATNSAIGPSAYMLFRVGPRILGAAPGGLLADRYRPQYVTAAVVAAQGALTAAILISVNSKATPLIYATVAAAQFAGAASRPLFPALIGIHTPQVRRGLFNSLDQIIAETSLFVAPALGAALLAVWSATAIIAIDVVTFAVAGAILVTLPASTPGGVASATLGQGASAGFRFVWARHPLRIGAAGLMFGGAVVTLLQSVLVVAAAQRFGGADRVGFCYSAVGVGGIVGGTLALRWRARRVTRSDIYLTALLQLAPLALLPLTDALLPALALLLISSMGGTVNWTFTTTYMQNHAPTDILGRVSAALTTANFVGMLVGALMALLLSQLLGWSNLLLWFSATCLVVLSLIALQSRSDTKTSAD
jgi:predicted MFS family arabinose efflux permease